MLFIIATPIGNLQDISYRAVATLKSCDYVLCEDTRRTKILCKHYEIETPLLSYHKFNEKSREEKLLSDLKEGKKIGLVSDAGMPLIADPGYVIVKRCREESLPFTCIPGASAVTTALALSGLDTTAFQFLGFMPKKPGAIGRLIERALNFPGTTVFFDTPHRLLKTLPYFPKDSRLVVIREMTKIYEEVVHGSPDELKEHFSKKTVKGEIVLLVDGAQN